jgi:hypothetical protein
VPLNKQNSKHSFIGHCKGRKGNAAFWYTLKRQVYKLGHKKFKVALVPSLKSISIKMRVVSLVAHVADRLVVLFDHVIFNIADLRH